MTLLDHVLSALGPQWYRVTVNRPNAEVTQQWVDDPDLADMLTSAHRLPLNSSAFWQMVDGPSKHADQNQPQTMIGRWQCRRMAE